MNMEKLKALLKEHVTLEEGHCCNDPDHECREITMFFDGDEIASVTWTL